MQDRKLSNNNYPSVASTINLKLEKMTRALERYLEGRVKMVKLKIFSIINRENLMFGTIELIASYWLINRKTPYNIT